MHFVYFIQAGYGGPIKIGIAEDPEQRLAWMQVGNHAELYLVAAIPGTLEAERALHERFAAGRIRGEWFELATPGLEDAIAEAATTEAAYWAADGRVCPVCLTPVDRPNATYCSPECSKIKALERSRNWRRRMRKAAL